MDSTFLFNQADGGSSSLHIRAGRADGGALYNAGTLSLMNSTLSRNFVIGGDCVGCGFAPEGGSARGGGIFTDGTLTVRSCTVTENRALGGGGPQAQMISSIAEGAGLLGPATLDHSIIAGNTADFFSEGQQIVLQPSDCFGTVTSNGYNLIGVDTDCTGVTNGLNGDQVGTQESLLDPRLGPLADNGGPTDTHALCTGLGVPHESCTAASPALDAGDNAACPATDQRGVERPQPPGGVCDIGAYEAQ